MSEEQKKYLESMGYVIIDKNDPNLTPEERLGIWMYEQRQYEKKLDPEQRESRRQFLNEQVKALTEMGISVETKKR